MHKGKYVFSQLLDFLDRNHFNYLVRKYGGNRYVKDFTCYNQLAAYDAGWFDIAARTDSAADSKLFAKQMTQMARMDAVRPQVKPAFGLLTLRLMHKYPFFMSGLDDDSKY